MAKDVIISESPDKVKTVNIAVDMPAIGFPVSMYCNRFGLEDVPNAEGAVLAHFGFVSTAGEVLSSYTGVLSKTMLMVNESDWGKYLGQVGTAPERRLDVSWRPPSSKIQTVAAINALRVGRTGIDAELRLYTVSMIAVIEKSREHAAQDKPIPAQPLAVLQSSLELQQLLLLALLKRVTK